jgi:gamma-glutamyltranspeptidase/glutathione hydrolase
MTSMMAPTLGQHRDGSLLTTGSGGSNRIRSAVLQVLLNIAEHGMSAEEAVLAPRLHLEGEHLSIEAGFAERELAALRRDWPDHRDWPEPNLFFGGVHTVLQTARGFSGAGDLRRDGVYLSV